MNISEELRENLANSPRAEMEMHKAGPSYGESFLNTKIAEVVDHMLDRLEAYSYETREINIDPIKNAVIETFEVLLDDLSTGSAIDTEWIAKHFEKGA